jgi:hypothetical protein
MRGTLRQRVGSPDETSRCALFVCEETAASYQASDWKQVDERITELGVERGAHERELCRQLLEAERLAIPSRVGFASLREYSERRLGLNGRQTEERLRVGRALVDLPALEEALSTGELCWSAVRELSRVAVPETESLVKHRLSFEVRAETMAAAVAINRAVRCRPSFAPSSGATSMTTWSCTKSRGEHKGAATRGGVRRIRWRF